MDKKAIGDRIAAMRERVSLNQSELSRLLKVSSQAVQQWEAGETSPRGKRLDALSSVLKTTPQYLLFGDTSALSVAGLGPAIQTPFRPVRVIDNSDQIEAGHDIFEVPRYTLRASAGTGEPVFEVDEKGQPNYCRSEWAKREGLTQSKLFSIRASGDSMEPKIPDGASITVHRQDEIASGRVHVLCRDGECYVKRLIKQMDGSLLIRSDNQADYKDLVLTPEQQDGLYVVGLVVSVAYNL